MAIGSFGTAPLAGAETGGFLSPDVGAILVTLLCVVFVIIWILRAYRVFDGSIQQGVLVSQGRGVFRKQVYIAIVVCEIIVSLVWLFKDRLFLEWLSA